MSFSTLMFWLCCGASYKLGAFNQKHPGRALHLARQGWRWLHA